MRSKFKPDGYTSVSPYLVVDGADGTIDFLVRALGAREIRRFPTFRERPIPRCQFERCAARTRTDQTCIHEAGRRPDR